MRKYSSPIGGTINISAIASGTWPLGGFDPSPADLYPQAAEWALTLLELSDRGEVALEPTETAIRLGHLARMGGWPSGQVVCLVEEHYYGDLVMVYDDISGCSGEIRSRQILPRLSLGIVVDGCDPSSPLVGFSRNIKQAAFPFPVEERPHWWERSFSTKVRVPHRLLAVLREPDGEALGVDYLSEADSRRVLKELCVREIEKIRSVQFGGGPYWWGRLSENEKDDVLVSAGVSDNKVISRQMVRDQMDKAYGNREAAGIR